MSQDENGFWRWGAFVLLGLYLVSSGPVLAGMKARPLCYIVGVVSVRDAGVGAVYYPLILLCRATHLERALYAYVTVFERD